MVAKTVRQPVYLQILSANARKMVATTIAPNSISSSVRSCQASEETKDDEPEDDQHPS